MGLLICSLSVMCCFFVLAPVVESQGIKLCPFWERLKTTPSPTLPPASNTQFYQKFKDIPPINVTADKLIENFFHISLHGNTVKRGAVLKDTVAILDSSASIGECEYEKGRRALKYLMKMKQSNPNDFYWAGVEYSTTATIKFKFKPAIEAANLVESTFKYEAGNTNTADGLAKANDLFNDSSTGWRKGANHVVFLITDGQSNTQQDKTVPNAQQLKDDGIKIFVVAIGDFKTGIDEIVRISSAKHEDHVFRVGTFGDLIEVIKLVVRKIAPDTYKVIGNIPPPC